jgi:hypothetical protein
MLRIVIGIIGACCAIAGIVFTASQWPNGVPLLVIGVLICISLLFEGRYRTAKVSRGRWQPTGEKFIDPATGKLVEVDYDPKTGERRYRDNNAANS